MTRSAKSCMRTLFITLAACAAVAPRVTAQEAASEESTDSEDSTPTDEHSKARRELMVQAMEKYSVIPDGNTVWIRPEAIVFGDPVPPFYTLSRCGDAAEPTF